MLTFVSMTFCRTVLFDEKKEIPEPLNLIQGGDDMRYDNPMLTFVSMTIGDGQHDVLQDCPLRRKEGGARPEAGMTAVS